MAPQAQSSAVGPGRAQGPFGAAYRVLEEAIAAHTFPGCAFGVWAGGEFALKDALGRFTYEQESAAVTAETVFDVASLTKVVATTAAAMLLVQRREIDVDAPLGDLLPGFVMGRSPGDQARDVTLRHLLAHNSGLPGYVEFFRTAASPESLFRACLELRLEAEPGTRAEYSDPGFMLLGKALEVRMGEDLAQWIKREVFRPLGMNATEFCPAPALRDAIPPTEEDTWFRHRVIQGEVQDENAWVLGRCGGTRRALLRCCGSSAFCFSDHQRRSGRRSGRKADSVRAGRAETIYPAARACGQLAGARMGYAFGEFVGGQAFFSRIPSGTSATAVARCGSTWKRRWPLFCSPIEPGPIERAS